MDSFQAQAISLESSSKTKAMLVVGIVFVSLFGGIAINQASQTKVSTCYYHFNIQYKAGLVETYDEIMFSMAHIIWMYGNHTTWNYTIETQFMTLEYMHDNFPDIFAELQDQNQRGQLELITPQYSDQWHIAYPLKNFKESVNYTQTRMAEWGLIPSKLILLQEGQWLPGFVELGNTGDFEAFIVHREQFGYFNYYPEEPVLEWTYQGKTKHVIVNPRMPREEAGIYHFQIYAADGELINTGDVEVDVGPAVRFAFNEDKQSNHEQHLMQLEARGNSFMRMDDFYEYCVDEGAVGSLNAPGNHFIPELEWVPNQYNQFFNWMGDGSGEVDDGQILARIYYGTQLCQAAELLLKDSYSKGIIDEDQYNDWGDQRVNQTDGLLLEAKKKIWEAQVSDSTGISPIYTEFWYAMNRTKEGIEMAHQVINNIRGVSVMGGNPYTTTIQINPYLGQVINTSSQFQTLSITESLTKEMVESKFKFGIEITQKEEYDEAGYEIDPIYQNFTYSTTTWNVSGVRMQLDFHGLYNITYGLYDNEFIAQETIENYITEGVSNRNDVSVKFIDNWPQAIYSPALVENQTQLLNRSDYYHYIEGAEFEWRCLLALSNGLLYNPNEGYGIIKNNTVRHIPGNWAAENVDFYEEGIKYGGSQEYFLVQGELEDLLIFANQINSYRMLEMEGI